MTASSTSAPAPITSTRPGCITGIAARSSGEAASSIAVTSRTRASGIREWCTATES